MHFTKQPDLGRKTRQQGTALLCGLSAGALIAGLLQTSACTNSSANSTLTHWTLPGEIERFSPALDPSHLPIESLIPRIQLNPSRQVLHSPSRLTLFVTDPLGDLGQFRLIIKYNGEDVTQKMLARAKIETRPIDRLVILNLGSITLSSIEQHQLDFYYKSTSGRVAHTRLEAPNCPAHTAYKIQNTGEFTASDDLLRTIHHAARSRNFNPAFLAGLIAQESGFDPLKVSWAKALGLTQVTRVAELEISRNYPHWPRYSALEGLHANDIKALIDAGILRDHNEWRLHPGMSIEGGTTYLSYLESRWASKEYRSLIENTFMDADEAASRLILASYHSGFTRVLTALQREGSLWLEAQELREARNYVNRVTSYCHAFTLPHYPPVESSAPTLQSASRLKAGNTYSINTASR